MPLAHAAAHKIDAVFEGGGVKGIGLAGAVSVLDEHGYTFENVAGTSAGAIVAALVAAGYTAAELKDTVSAIDYGKFEDPGALGEEGIPKGAGGGQVGRKVMAQSRIIALPVEGLPPQAIVESVFR